MISLEQFAYYIEAHPTLKCQEDFPRNTQVHYSQNGEDVIISAYLVHHLPPAARGIFVDFGAYHPYRFSNTFLLYQLGWRGVNVDANREAIELFKVTRPEDTNLHCLLSDKSEELEYFKFSEGAFNGTNSATVDILRSRCSSADSFSYQVERMTAHTPNHILELSATHRPIDFMNIDLEGADERVLRSIDFTRFRPKLIAIEAELENALTGSLREFIDSHGYRVLACCVATLLLEDKSWR